MPVITAARGIIASTEQYEIDITDSEDDYKRLILTLSEDEKSKILSSVLPK